MGKVPADYTSRIRQLRTLLDLTQAQLAQQIGVTVVTVARWETGRARPSPLAWRQIEELEKEAPPPKK
jgi:putative transcriptional regulator